MLHDPRQLSCTFTRVGARRPYTVTGHQGIPGAVNLSFSLVSTMTDRWPITVVVLTRAYKITFFEFQEYKKNERK